MSFAVQNLKANGQAVLVLALDWCYIFSFVIIFFSNHLLKMQYRRKSTCYSTVIGKWEC